MSIIACKYFENHGYVAIKARDKDFKPDIMIRKSVRRDMERLYIWDLTSRFAEGINEFGVCILSLELEASDKELLASRLRVSENTIKSPRKFQSEDGIRIRTALFGKTVEEAAKILVESETVGIFFVFDEQNCCIVNGAFNENDFVHTVEVCSHQYGYVRHTQDNEYSDVVISQLNKELLYARSPIELLDSMAIKVENGQGVIKTDISRRKVKTVSQALLCSKERTIHFRPIYGTVNFNLDNLIPGETQKTFFEVVSTRKLISFQNYSKQN